MEGLKLTVQLVQCGRYKNSALYNNVECTTELVTLVEIYYINNTIHVSPDWLFAYMTRAAFTE